jgi:hypothetical protein
MIYEEYTNLIYIYRNSVRSESAYSYTYVCIYTVYTELRNFSHLTVTHIFIYKHICIYTEIA